MRRPMQEIAIFGVRPTRANAGEAAVDRSTRDRREAAQQGFSHPRRGNRYRVLLVQAVAAGQRVDEATGEPESCHAAMGDLHVHEWARQWLAQQWEEWLAADARAPC